MWGTQRFHLSLLWLLCSVLIPRLPHGGRERETEIESLQVDFPACDLHLQSLIRTGQHCLLLQRWRHPENTAEIREGRCDIWCAPTLWIQTAPQLLWPPLRVKQKKTFLFILSLISSLHSLSFHFNLFGPFPTSNHSFLFSSSASPFPRLLLFNIHRIWWVVKKKSLDSLVNLSIWVVICFCIPMERYIVEKQARKTKQKQNRNTDRDGSINTLHNSNRNSWCSSSRNYSWYHIRYTRTEGQRVTL